MWSRKCQECGHRQVAKEPEAGTLTDSYANSKCRKCKSEALDYGTDAYIKDDKGNWINANANDDEE